MQQFCEQLVDWLRDVVSKAKAKGAVFGMSGGLDSSVVSVICKKSFQDEVLGLIMPCYSDKSDEKDAIMVAEKFDINYKVINLDSIYDQFLNTLDRTNNNMAKANLKPRLRMMTLYYYASINNYLVVGAENKSEIALGYFTKYGDGAADVFPLANLVKGQVKELAKLLNVPKTIIEKVPSAGLWEGQTDENELGISYEELDRYILTGKASNFDVENKISNIIKKSEHKRKPPLMPNF